MQKYNIDEMDGYSMPWWKCDPNCNFDIAIDAEGFLHTIDCFVNELHEIVKEVHEERPHT